MKNAIIKTLSYAAIFNFPLTDKEIHQYLIGKKTSLKNLQTYLVKLKIPQKNGYYHLKTKTSIIDRQSLKSHNQQKLNLAHKYTRLLKLFSHIQAVYVTGALSMSNATPKDDIDFLIITSPYKLWTTRFFVNIFFDLLGLRRKPNSKDINNKACLNLWLTTKSSKLPKSFQNLYVAHEVAQAKLLWSRKNDDPLLTSNNWINKFLPNINLVKNKKASHPKTKPNITENLLYNLQINLMSKRRTIEKVSKEKAFFHPKNTQNQIIKKYQQIYKKHAA